MQITYEDFEKIDIRTGRIVKVEEFPRARKPSYRVQVDFGAEIGLKWSSVGAASEYKMEEMMDRWIVAVVNFPPKNIAGFLSEVLVLGVSDEKEGLVLLQPSRTPKIGSRAY